MDKESPDIKTEVVDEDMFEGLKGMFQFHRDYLHAVWKLRNSGKTQHWHWMDGWGIFGAPNQLAIHILCYIPMSTSLTFEVSFPFPVADVARRCCGRKSSMSTDSDGSLEA